MKKTITAILAIAFMAVPAYAIAGASTYTILARGVASTIMDVNADRPNGTVNIDEILEVAVEHMKGNLLPARTDRYSILYDIDKKGKVIIHTMMIVDRGIGYLKANIGRGDVFVDIYDAIKWPETLDEVIEVAKASIVEQIKDDPVYADLFSRGYTFRYQYIYVVDKKKLFAFYIDHKDF